MASAGHVPSIPGDNLMVIGVTPYPPGAGWEKCHTYLVHGVYEKDKVRLGDKIRTQFGRVKLIISKHTQDKKPHQAACNLAAYYRGIRETVANAIKGQLRDKANVVRHHFRSGFHYMTLKGNGEIELRKADKSLMPDQGGATLYTYHFV